MPGTAGYDVIVVGARCAGAATAMLLARSGLHVLVVDKAVFPSDTVSTHYIHQPGVARLRDWGLLDRLAATGCPPLVEQVFDVGPFALRGAPPPSAGVATGYAPRRTVLDHLLVRAAAEAGAEVRESFAVKELLVEEGVVTGVRGRTDGGTPIDERARLVIGADGLRSVVARLAGAPTYDEQPAASCAYYSYWSGIPLDVVELYPRPGRMLIAAPTHDDLTLVIGYWPIAEFPQVRADVETAFLDAVDEVPVLADRVRAGERAERFRGSADLDGFRRRPFGPGWALVGDAGYHKNPITALGITDAFRDADLLATAVVEGLSGRRPLDEALADYEAARNAASGPLYGLTTDLGRLEPPPPQMQAIMGALVGDPVESGRFLGTIAGTVALDDFFSPANVARILGTAAAPA